MLLDSQRIGTREKLILAGLYLSKYNSLGLKKLGFESFVEAYNAVGYAMGSRPASVKNYRDEFDPLFPNKRKGWHKRPIRENCRKVYEEYKNLDLEAFTGLIRSFCGYEESVWSGVDTEGKAAGKESQFANRLFTGLAAERYFESVHTSLPEFIGYESENTTRLGCGYDFRLQSKADEAFLAVEVKGLKGREGSVSLTTKEYEVANELRDRFFLFVVKNFIESPFHQIFRDPLSGSIEFTRQERVLVQVSWLAAL